jgi:hypothetical protein
LGNNALLYEHLEVYQRPKMWLVNFCIVIIVTHKSHISVAEIGRIRNFVGFRKNF